MSGDAPHLKRRSALGLLGLAPAALATPALVTPALVTPALAQGRTQWRMVTSWPRNLPGPGVTAQRLADRIGEASGGRLAVTLYAAGEVVPALEVFQAVSDGTAQMGHTASLYQGGRIAAAPLFTAGPFGLTPLEHIAWIEHGGGQALWDEAYGAYGVRPFMAGNTGFQMGGWFRDELTGLDDLRGLRIRMPGLGGEVMRRLGAAPVTLPAGEILTALQTGVIDATEFLGPFSDFAAGFWRVARNYYAPGWHEPNGTGEALVSAAAYDALPADLRAVVRDACRAENIVSLTEAEWSNGAALGELKSRGVVVRDFPADIIAAARRETTGVIEDVAARDPVSARIVASYRSAAEHLDAWSKISVQRFLSARV